MNAAQVGRLHRLLLDAAHPRTCPITGQFYTPDEMAEHGCPMVHMKGYTAARDGDPEMLEIEMTPARLHGDRLLYLDPSGNVCVWSTVRIPAEDCDCECGKPIGFSDGAVYTRDECPQHGNGVRELDCFRRVKAIGWELVNAPHPLASDTRRESQRLGDEVGGVDVPVSAGTIVRWRYVVRDGDPIRDVLAEYRAERAAAKAAA